MIAFFKNSIPFWELRKTWFSGVSLGDVTQVTRAQHRSGDDQTIAARCKLPFQRRAALRLVWTTWHSSRELFMMKRLTALYIIIILTYFSYFLSHPPVQAIVLKPPLHLCQRTSYNDCYAVVSPPPPRVSWWQPVGLWLDIAQASLLRLANMQLIPRQLHRPSAEELKGSSMSNWAARVFKRRLPLQAVMKSQLFSSSKQQKNSRLFIARHSQRRLPALKLSLAHRDIVDTILFFFFISGWTNYSSSSFLVLAR